MSINNLDLYRSKAIGLLSATSLVAGYCAWIWLCGPQDSRMVGDDSPQTVALKPTFRTFGGVRFDQENGQTQASSPVFQFRGSPTRQGVTYLQKSPTIHGKRWCRPLNIGVHTAAKSSPIFDGERLYVGADGGMFFALDLSGEVIWRYAVNHVDKGFHGTAAIDEDALYIGSYDGRFAALDKRSGRPIWVARLGDAIGASPLLIDDQVVIAVETMRPDGFVVALNRRTGEQLWASPWLGGHAHSSVAWHEGSGKFFVGENKGSLSALDPRDGSFVWRFKTEGSIKGTPAIINERVVFTSWDRKLRAVDIERGQEIWNHELGGRSTSSPAFAPQAGVVVVGVEDGLPEGQDRAGALVAVDVQTGREVWRRFAPPDVWRASATVTVVNGAPSSSESIWIECESGYLCQLQSRTGKLLGRWEIGAPFTAAPFVSEDFVVVAANEPGELCLLGSQVNKKDELLSR